jgi:hypothetical protein
MVSTDQYVSKVTGQLPHMRGKESEQEQYIGGMIYVDEASGFIYAKHQVSLGANETVRGKHLFEREAGTCGVAIQNYRGDNGVYKTMEFRKDLADRKQTIQFSGVGAHHQNGIAERVIRTISESARASNVAAFGNTLAGRSDVGLVAYGYGLCYLSMEQDASKGHWDCTDRDLLWL